MDGTPTNRQRLLPTTSQAALACSVLAVVIASTGVGPADAARAVKRALMADNSKAVNGIKASRTPRAGQLLALDRNGRFPTGVLPDVARGPRGLPGPPGPPGPAAAAVDAPNPAVFRAHAVADQTTANGGAITVLFGGEDFDPGNVFDPGTSTFTAPVTGYYEFATTVSTSTSGHRLFPQITTSRAGMKIRGTDLIGTGLPQVVAAGIMRLQRGDTVWVDLYTASTNTVNRVENITMFSGALVAPG